MLWAAHVYANKDRRLGNLHQIMMPVVPGILVATGLVVFGHDLGTALVLFAILLGMLWVVGAPARVFALSFLVVSVFAGALAAADPERLTRITTFTDPMRDYNSAGWQPAHGLFALSSGGLFGQGIGASQQKWGNLPEAHTDFIFAVLGEELGLVGTLLVIGLFLTIAYAAIRVARRTKDPFVRYMTFGIVVWIIGQMMINVGMVLALLPVIGIPMPLVSYGGSALVPSLVALGMLVGFARREPEAARALAQRKRGRNSGVTAGSVTKKNLLATCASCSREAARPATPPRCSPPPMPCNGCTPASRSPASAPGSGSRRRSSRRRATRWSSSPASRCRVARTPTWRRLPGRLRAARGAALEVVDRIRPDVICGFGGFVSVPAYLAARSRKVPLVVHEGNTVPGVANKLGARFTDHVATSFPDTPLRHATYVGLPIRRMIATLDRAAHRDEALAAFGLRRRPAGAAGDRRLAGRGVDQPRRARLGAGLRRRRRPGAARRRPVPRGRRRPTPACRTSSSASSTGWTSPTPRPTRCCAARAPTR